MSQYVRKISLQKGNFRGAKDLDHLAEMMADHLHKVTKSIQEEFTNVERAGGISQQETNNAIANASSSSSGGTTISITDYMRAGTSAVTTAGTAILFTSDMGAVPTTFQFRCYNSAGDTIGCAITLLTSTGFTATPLEDSVIEYVATRAI